MQAQSEQDTSKESRPSDTPGLPLAAAWSVVLNAYTLASTLLRSGLFLARDALRRVFAALWGRSETSFFHLAVLAVIASAVPANLTALDWFIVLAYAVICLAVYWAVLILVRRPGTHRMWWERHLLNPELNRVSVGVVVVLLDVIHVFLFLASILLVSANLMYCVEKVTVGTWTESFFITLVSAGVGRFNIPVPATAAGRLLLMANSMIGLLFVAVWVAVFMKVFEVGFQFFRKK